MKVDLVFFERLHHAIAREHRGAGDDGCGRNSVDANVRAEVDREFSYQVIESCLARVVSLAAFLRDHSVGGTGKHHGGRQTLIFEYPLRLPGKKIVAGDVDQKGLRPLCFGEFPVDAGHGIYGGRVDDDIKTAKLRNREMCRFRKRGSGTEIDGNVCHKLRRRYCPNLIGDLARTLLVKICNDDVSAPACEQHRNFPADSASTANDERNLAAEFCFCGHALELGFFKSPIFNAECLGSWERDIVMEVRELLRLLGVPSLRQRMRNFSILQGIRASHDVNGVDEKLGCDPRFFLVLAETE